ncbi:MAG: hypothetical protein ABJO09_18650 [Hyphomicrobiales bacterium]
MAVEMGSGSSLNHPSHAAHRHRRQFGDEFYAGGFRGAEDGGWVVGYEGVAAGFHGWN